MTDSRKLKNAHAAKVLDRHYTIVPDEWYSIRDAARLLLVHRCTIYELIKKERNPLQGKKVGAHYKFLGADLIDFRQRYIEDPRSKLLSRAMFLDMRSAQA